MSKSGSRSCQHRKKLIMFYLFVSRLNISSSYALWLLLSLRSLLNVLHVKSINVEKSHHVVIFIAIQNFYKKMGEKILT